MPSTVKRLARRSWRSGRCRWRFCLRLLGQPEIQHLRAGFRQHDVARLQVAMNHSLLMGFIHRIGDLGTITQHLFQRQLPRCKRSASVSPPDTPLPDNRAILRANVVKPADVGMRKLGDGARFTFEALLQARSGDKCPERTLMATSRSRRVSRHDRPHPCRLRRAANNFVRSEFRARGYSHRCAIIAHEDQSVIPNDSVPYLDNDYVELTGADYADIDESLRSLTQTN